MAHIYTPACTLDQCDQGNAPCPAPSMCRKPVQVWMGRRADIWDAAAEAERQAARCAACALTVKCELPLPDCSGVPDYRALMRGLTPALVAFAAVLASVLLIAMRGHL